ncbi:hypothetical protein ACUXG3_005840 [Bacillus thuringiensis]
MFEPIFGFISTAFIIKHFKVDKVILYGIIKQK